MKHARPLTRSCLFFAALLAMAGGAASAEGRWVSHPSAGFEILGTEATVGDFLDCVGRGECSRESASETCNAGDPSRRDHPINCIDHPGATALCASLGGRLCTSAEWLAACRGTDARAFPYGSEFDPARCHAGSYENPGPGGRQTVEVGSIPDCEGGLPGLFDMAGNVSEWMADCKDDYCKFRGAAYLGNEPVSHFASCGDVCSGNSPTLRSGTVGVRCCRDEAP